MGLGRNIFEDALATGNLDYAFDMEIQKLETNDDGVVVYAGDKRIRAKKAVCTIPLNVLKTIEVHSSRPSKNVPMRG